MLTNHPVISSLLTFIGYGLLASCWTGVFAQPPASDQPTVLSPSEQRSRQLTSNVAKLFQNYCSGCHNDREAESGISLASLAQVRDATTDHGPLIDVQQPEKSRLIEMLTGRVEPQMPPKEEPQPTQAEIELIRQWIVADAPSEDASTDMPAHSSNSTDANSVDNSKSAISAAVVMDHDRIGLGGFGQIKVVRRKDAEQIGAVTGFAGKITSLRSSVNNRLLVVGSGVAGVRGEIVLIDSNSLEIIQRLNGHQDMVYCAAISADGKWLASGSYDRKIILWNIESGQPAVHITGHNGAIYDLDFHPNGRMLASASGDQTIKLWSVPDGSRLDTLGQPEGEMRSVRFSADGQLLYGAGGDRQIRQWRVDPSASTGSPMILARYAHEREVLRFELLDDRYAVSASADASIKLWTLPDLLPLRQIATAKNLPIALCGYSDQSLTIVDLAGQLQVLDRSDWHEIPRPSTTTVNSTKPATTDAESPSNGVSPSGPPATIDEIEPNNLAKQAMRISPPIEIRGGIDESGRLATSQSDSDSDLFEFQAEAGKLWIIELIAASDESLKSPLDSLVDILDAQGRLVLQTRLQALRESYFSFRGKDNVSPDDFRMHKWEEMEIDQYLYSNGEVTRLWRYPRGPDSGFKVYPGAGARHTFFGTTAISHALGESAYIVRPLERDEQPLPNGLPIFPIYFENDDDPIRERGRDSRLNFVAPEDGHYFIRVRDARGFGGQQYRYRLVIRHPQPDFELSFGGLELSAAVGTGVEWSVKAKRVDGMDNAIAINLHDLPSGVHATNPLIIEAGQLSSVGTIFVDPVGGTAATEHAIRISAQTLDELGNQSGQRWLDQQIKLTVSDTKSLKIALLPNRQRSSSGDKQSTAETESISISSQANASSSTAATSSTGADMDAEPVTEELTELSIRPGQTVSARLRIQRNGVEGPVGFGTDDSGRNLPHGSFVGNVGLNGLLIVEGQDEREFFITAATKVRPGRYQFHVRSLTNGNPTSRPVWLNVLP